jgi:hypothetical protein
MLVWCSPVYRHSETEIMLGHETDGQRCQESESRTQGKTVHRASPALDNRKPHMGSARLDTLWTTPPHLDCEPWNLGQTRGGQRCSW